MSQNVFITFALGKKEAYFFNSPTRWARYNLPAEIEALFTKQPPIKDILELALGENGSWFVSFREQDGGIGCRHYNLPNPLISYLYSSTPNVTRSLPTLSLTLGPYDSYFVSDVASASWSNLPAALEKALLHRIETHDTNTGKVTWKEGGRERPCFVSLGADGAFFMRTVGGGGCFDLGLSKIKGNPTGLEGLRGIGKFLEDSPNFSNIVGLYLFPSFLTSYVLLLNNGKAFSNLPEHTWADYKKMESSFPDLTSKAPARPTMMAPQMGLQQQQQQQNATAAGCCGPTMVMNQNCCPPTMQMQTQMPIQRPMQPMMQPVQPMQQMRPMQPLQPFQPQPMQLQRMPLQPVQPLQPLQPVQAVQMQQPMMQPMQPAPFQPVQTMAFQPLQTMQPMQPMQPMQMQPLQTVQQPQFYPGSPTPSSASSTPLPVYPGSPVVGQGAPRYG